MKAIPLAIHEDRVAEFCRRHRIERRSLFGSILRGDFRPESHVDVLVEFEPGRTPGWYFFSVQDELNGIIRQEVDVNRSQFVSK